MYRKLLVFLLLSSPVYAAEKPAAWSQWRGPNRDGSIAKQAWPEKLDEKHLTKKWRVPLGPSYSGPLIAMGRVFVTETRDRKTEHVLAFDLKTGKKLWEVSWKGSLKVPFFAARNGSWIRSTPAFDGESLFVGGIRDVLVCIDAIKGEEKWRVDFKKEFNTSVESFGYVCSPLVDSGAVYTQTAAGLIKLDAKTGKTLWRSMKEGGGMMGGAFSSPIMTRLADRKLLLVQSRKELATVDPKNGKVLWSKPIPSFRGMNILTPVVADNRVFTSSYGGGAFGFSTRKVDGKLALDQKWKTNTQAYMSSPVVISGHVYLHLRNRRFVCIDLKTGETKWTSRPYGQYWSLIASGNRILALDQTGTLRLIRANPEQFDLIAERKVSDQETWAHLAIMGDVIAIRELNAISIWTWRPAE